MVSTPFTSPEPYEKVDRPLMGQRAITPKETEAQATRQLVGAANEMLEPGRWYILKRMPAHDEFGSGFVQLGWDELAGDPPWKWDDVRACWTTIAQMAVRS